MSKLANVDILILHFERPRGIGTDHYAIRIQAVVLAGGSGGRLFPLTKITNKHLPTAPAGGLRYGGR